MNNPASQAGNDAWSRLIGVMVSLAAIGFLTGCASQPIVTTTIYEDRSAWIRLEINPDADDSVTASRDGLTPPSSATITALFKGLKAEKDYNAGVISYAIDKSFYNRIFVEPELMVLTPQLAKGLAMASPQERVAFCLTADYVADERFITTGWVYLKKPYLYFKLVEWRTPIRVKSPATPTGEACLVKPFPGTKTVDRFFQLDYEPRNLIVTHGPLGESIYNKRGEVVFKLAGLDLRELLGASGRGNGSAQKSPRVSESSTQPVSANSAVTREDKPVQEPSASVPQPKRSKEVTRQPQNHTKPKPFNGSASAGETIP